MKRAGALGAAAAILALMAAAAPAAYSQASGVGVESYSVGSTIIVELDNSQAVPIHSVKLWIAEGNSFESFKTGAGWTGVRQAPNLLVFTAASPLASGESAKFGVVAAAQTETINWQALDAADVEISRDASVPGERSAPPPDAPPGATPPPEGTDGPEDDPAAVLDSSTFKVIPTGPNVGSTIRVVGEGFGTGKTVTLLLGSLNLSTIDTGDSGRFVHTATIPPSTPAERVDFTLTDGTGNTLQKSVRLGEARSRMMVTQDGSDGLTIDEFPEGVTSGDVVEMSGTGKPGTFILVTLRHPSDYAIWINQIRIDSNGQWSESFKLPVSSIAGRYTVVVTDGATSLTKSWDVGDGLQVNVLPSRLAYNPGDSLIFRGTATPGVGLEASLLNPQNILLYEDSLEIDASGAVSFEIPTTTNYPKGTYVLFLRQGIFETVVPVGLGGPPDQPFVVRTDKLNYVQTDTALISIRGLSSSDATFSVVDTSKHDTLLTAPIKLDADGVFVYPVDLANYTRGIYTATVNYGKNSAEYEFGVGLQYNTGAITASTIKASYQPTEPIIVLGETDKLKSLIDIVLVNPSGEEVKTISTFSDGRVKGKFSAVFAIHSNSELGTWQIVARSGKNTAEAPFEVVVTRTTNITVTTSEVPSSRGNTVLVSGEGAMPNQQITVSISHSRGEVIEDDLLTRSTRSGTFSMEWPDSDNLPAGTYTIRATDSSGRYAETTYEVG